jgi:hypothetical protein
MCEAPASVANALPAALQLLCGGKAERRREKPKGESKRQLHAACVMARMRLVRSQTQSTI